MYHIFLMEGCYMLQQLKECPFVSHPHFPLIIPSKCLSDAYPSAQPVHPEKQNKTLLGTSSACSNLISEYQWATQYYQLYLSLPTEKYEFCSGTNFGRILFLLFIAQAHQADRQ